jgi:hypothetical protein
MDWDTIRGLGHFGARRDEIKSDLDSKLGKGNWRIRHIWGEQIIDDEMTFQIYEDAYYEFLKERSEVLDLLLRTAQNDYNNAISNIQSGLDYHIQENEADHLQDIAIRRVVLRLGKKFEGNSIVQVRGQNSEGYALSPGVVPFHLPDMIKEPHLEGWWNKDSIEDFYQSNKVLQVRK